MLIGGIFLIVLFRGEHYTLAGEKGLKQARLSNAMSKGIRRNGDDGSRSIRLEYSAAAAAMIPLQPPAASSIADGVDKLYYCLDGHHRCFSPS